MHEKFAGVLFDKDGTLFDFEESWGAWTENLLNELADQVPERVRAMADALGFDPEHRSFIPGSPAVAGSVEEIARALLPFRSDMTLAALTRHLDAAVIMVEAHPAVPLRPLLLDLRASGFRLGVATNDAVEAARVHLQSADILDLFPFLAGYDSGYGAKPEPGMCRAFAEHCNLAPESIVMVGDSVHDLIAARAASMVAVAVLTGPATAEDLAPYADAILPDIGHLPRWLEAPSIQ